MVRIVTFTDRRVVAIGEDPWPRRPDLLRAAVLESMRQLSVSLLAWMPSEADRNELVRLGLDASPVAFSESTTSQEHSK